MSIHINNPELDARLAAQRRNSTIASALIGLLLIALIGLIFWLITINFVTKKVDPIVAYSEEAVEEDTIEKVKVKTSVQKTPSSPSSSAVQIITATAPSSFALPSPDTPIESLSVDFGDSDGFGDGWGGGSGGFGSGGSGAFSFMGSKMKGNRVCFVIDYSKSMKGKRIELLKAELEKTISDFPEDVQYQMVFFAGPAWVAGSTVSSVKGSATITFDNKGYKWTGRGAFNWQQSGDKQPVDWLKADKAQVEESLKAIRETQLVWGTSWSSPIEMAMNMAPEPDLVVFLTDGSSGGDSMQKAKDLGGEAKKRGIKVNTIALMEPSARDAMAELASISGGEFSLIGEDGKKVRQDNGGQGIK